MGPDSSSGPTGPLLPASFGRYTLLERVGGGGMATVYRASLSGVGGFEKEVAVKVIRVELAEDPQFTQMFLDEARLSARLNHANIVQTFDFGQEENVHFLAMELVHGRTLAALLKICKAKGTRLGLGPSLRVAAELARALDYAHRLVDIDGKSLGIVHRDVSPQNVLVSREGEVKLADFGIAKAVMRSHVTQPGRVRGKCAYMAPEQIRGKELDGRADVFALGVILWESLVGRSLFDGSSDAAVLHQVLEKEILPPSWFVREIPTEVDALVMRLLSREVEDRPDSGQASRALADLIWKVVRSEADIDLAELQRRLNSGTAVYVPAASLAALKVAEPASGGRAAAPQPTTVREELLSSSMLTIEEGIAAESGRGAPPLAMTRADRGEVREQSGPLLEPAADPGAETLIPERRVVADGGFDPKDAGRSGATTAPIAPRPRRRGGDLRLAEILAIALAVGAGIGVLFDLRGSDWIAAVTSPGAPAAEEPAALDEAGLRPTGPSALLPAEVAEANTVQAANEVGSDSADVVEARTAAANTVEATNEVGSDSVNVVAARTAAANTVEATRVVELDPAAVAELQAAETADAASPPGLEAGRSGSADAQEDLPYMGVILWGGTTPPSAEAVGGAKVPKASRSNGEGRGARSVVKERKALPRVEKSAGKGGHAPAGTEMRSPPPGELAVSSMLDGATLVTIDGVPSQTLGRRAPARLTLSAGRHRVAFSHEESGMYCGVVAEIPSGKMLALNADANGVGILKGAVRTPIPCTERR